MSLEGAFISAISADAWLAGLLATTLIAAIALGMLRRETASPWTKRLRQSGNVFVILFGAIGIAGLIGAGAMQTMKGPTRSLSTSNHVATANNDLYNAARLVANAPLETPDCDADGLVEPTPWRDPGSLPAPTNGGLIPQEIGSSKRDAWGTEVGYCVWDHGSRTVSHDVAGCGGEDANRLEGTNSKTEYAIAIISAGPDRIFQTTCNPWVDANDDDKPDNPLIQTLDGSDDIVRPETITALFAEGGSGSQLEELPDDACNSSSLGTMRYDAGTVQICREGGWEEVGSAVQASGNFIPQTNVPLNVPRDSNAISFSGFFGTRTASVEGGSGAVLFINSVNVGTSGEIKAGDTVYIRANAAGTPATTLTFTLHVSSSRRAWTLTTRDPTPPSLAISVVSGNASAMNVAYTGSTSYGSPVRFQVANSGEAPSAVFSDAQLDATTNFEIVTDNCSGVSLAGGAHCTIDVRPLATGSGPIGTDISVTAGAITVNASMSGAATGWPCPDPWGGTVNSGDSITAYSASSVPCGDVCASIAQTRTCSPTTGQLSGSLTVQNCAPVVCVNCTVAVGTPWTVSGQTCHVPSEISINHAGNASATDATLPATGGATFSCTNGTVSISTSTCTDTADRTPNSFSVPNQSSQALNTQVTSASVAISGIDYPTTISVSGDGSPEISVAGGAWATSGSISNGQSFRVRLTTANTGNTTRSATVDIHGVTNTWNVTTINTVTPGSQSFASTGSHTFVVPAYNTLTVEVWGGGGGGGGPYGEQGGQVGQAGGTSSFNSTVVGNGGSGGGIGSYWQIIYGGAGGTASGGDTNTTGQTGSNAPAYSYSGAKGGNAPNGGGGGVGGGYAYTDCSGPSPGNGVAPGGGGGGASGDDDYVAGGGGGGAGGYSSKTYSSGQLTVGGNIPVQVGNGGAGYPGYNGYSCWVPGNGAVGRVSITWN